MKPGIKPGITLSAIAFMAAAMLPAQAADSMPLYDGKPPPSWHVTVAGLGGADHVMQGASLTLPKPEGGQPGTATARAGKVAGRPGALTLEWKDTWHAGWRLEGGAPLDLRPYLSPNAGGGTLEFDINVADLAKGGMYFSMRCGAECNRKVQYVLPGRALQGKGWQHLSFSMACFARDSDDFSQVPVPFAFDTSGTGKVSLANIKLVRDGKSNAPCPDYRTEAVTPAPLTHAWALEWWMPRHEKKLAENRKLVEEGKNPQVVFIGDSITEGWEKAGQAVWKQYYEKYHAVALGFSGDHTENVLWRLQHGEVDGIAPKAAVLMIGTNNTGDRQDEPQATADGVKAIIGELRQRLPRTKILLLAIFPRDEQPSAFQRRLNNRINAIIAGYADGKDVFYADINSALLNSDGTLSRDVMPDMLHPGPKGYEIWARSIEPGLQKLLSE